MIVLGNTYISDDVKEKLFVCNLEKCKGACCVEGDIGAPLSEEETKTLDEIYEDVAPFLSDAGRRVIEKEGTWTTDEDGEWVTPTISKRECVYAIYDEKGILKCGIEQAFLAGKTHFHKPISCHLYPIRITKYEQFEALNYHQWHICSPACTLGEQLGVPVYKFLKNPLIRKYGADWYNELTLLIENTSGNKVS